MRILDNKTYREMTENEIREFDSDENDCGESKDSLTTLAEGLSTATSLAQVRNSAKAVLGDVLNES